MNKVSNIASPNVSHGLRKPIRCGDLVPLDKIKLMGSCCLSHCDAALSLL